MMGLPLFDFEKRTPNLHRSPDAKTIQVAIDHIAAINPLPSYEECRAIVTSRWGRDVWIEIILALYPRLSKES